MTTEVSIHRIGGTSTLVGSVEYSEVQWTKEMDNFGEATVRVSAQCVVPELLGTHPWVHELRIAVDGEVAWVGPIEYVALPLHDRKSAELIIFARELSYWFTARFARQDIDFEGTDTDVAEVVRQLVQTSMAIDDPNMIDFLDFADSCDVIHDRAVVFNDNLWEDHLGDIVGNLMHMRSHGRTVSFWCYGECNGELPRARTDEFDNFDNLVYDGVRFATDAFVFGRDEIAEQAEVLPDAGPPVIVGSPAVAAQPAVTGSAGAGGSTAFPGVRVERTFRDTSYLNDASATRFAENAVLPRAPLGFIDQSEFRAETNCESPWPITRVAPGMCSTLGTPFGDINIQVQEVGGRVSNRGVESFYIGMNELQLEQA